jgi:hypothetical protein
LQDCFVNWGKHDGGLEKMTVGRELGCRAPFPIGRQRRDMPHESM